MVSQIFQATKVTFWNYVIFSKYNLNFKDKYSKYFNMISRDVQNEILSFIKSEIEEINIDFMQF